MRLVYVLLSPTFGMHQYTADLANRMATIHDVHLVTMSGYPEDRYSSKVSASTPVDLKSTGLAIEGLFIWRLFKIIRELMRLGPDVVHITGPHLWNVLLMFFLRYKRIPLLHTIHDVVSHSGTRMGSLLPVWNKLVARLSDHILVHGERYRQSFLNDDIPEDRVTFLPLLHLFLSSSLSDRLQQKPAEISYEPFILFFGRIELYKGLDTLLTAYRLMVSPGHHTQHANPRLVLAGPGALSTKWTKHLPGGVDYRSGVISDEEALELFSNCSLVVMPYTDGTQSALIAAAYFFRKPVIVTKVGALAEYVQEGETGWLVNPGNPAMLSAAMREAVSDTERLRKMGDACRKWYDERRIRETENLKMLYIDVMKISQNINDGPTIE